MKKCSRCGEESDFTVPLFWSELSFSWKNVTDNYTFCRKCTKIIKEGLDKLLKNN